MKFTETLEKGVFLKRYKRFFADIETPKGIEIAHVPNTGSLKGVAQAQSSCLFSRSADPNRKLKLTLEAIEVSHNWVGVNTSWPNKIAVEAFDKGLFEHWKKYDRIQAEVKISAESRVDLVMWNSKDFAGQKISFKDIEKGGHFHLVEIKNTTLADQGCAQFPDAVTERGQKHLQELMSYMKKGCSAELLFVVQREDCSRFMAAKDIDPDYAQLLQQAHHQGMRVTPAIAKIDNQQVSLTGKTLPFTI